ncbi:MULTISPECIES: ROK family protein [unclassified Aureispira]|uniref:ROK family protein n=1 Tax=unclassified Aureispira TaxID=2649989 RepID=UPI000698B840|nr:MULTISPECIES: ROK family protein [unclassified Aureispira]WMX12214.1 ROK family protein [Aureispira sp. CCB-E]
MKVSVGIDIGGTNTVWGIIDEQGQVQLEGNIRTKDYTNPNDFVAKLALDIKEDLQLHPQFELVGMGVGAPNGNYFNGTIEHAPNLIWKGIVPLQKMFQTHFDLPVWITNDANAAAIGEMLFGAAKGMKDFVVVTLGTGLGSGFVVNGELIYGHDAFAGELGHTIIERDGRLCGCSRKGCLETYASATGIVRTAKERLEHYEGKSLLQEQERISSRIIAECAEKGDALALEIFDYTAQQLGYSLANTVAITSPEAIILFGGLANSGALIAAPTKHYMEAYMLNIFQNKVKLLVSTVPQHHAAILGAGALAWKNVNGAL